MTQRIYEQDAYCRRFEAQVLSCEAQGEAFAVVLDKTAFFPEGGGQAADGGTINDIAVLDVQQKGEAVVHTLAAPLPVGETVCGVLDWETRFARMQSHAGEHVLSGWVHRLFGYANVGFHMSDTLMTVDFDGPLTKEDVERVERCANRSIYENAPITVSFPSAAELESIDCRSKIEVKEGIRLVTVENVDCCACCAPHPAATGEIGCIKVISFCPYKGGTRLEMLAGVHALEEYAALNTAHKQIMALLSAARDELPQAVEKQLETVRALRAENQKLSRQLALATLRPVAVGEAAYALSNGLSYDELLHCANHLLENGKETCILFSKTDGAHLIYVVCGKNDVRDIVQKLNAALDGKGGGRGNHAQGKIAVVEEQAVCAAAEQLLSNL